MNQLFARLFVRKSVAFGTAFAVLLVAVASLFGAARIKQDDDLLAFLPKDDPDVRTFYEVNRRFGGLDVALIGIRSDDVFAPDFLARLRGATRALNTTEGIGYALSLTNVEDFTADTEKGGIGIDYLIPSAPADPAALKEKVMGRAEVVNNLISADGKAVLLYGFLAYGAEPKATAARVRAIVEEAFPREAKYWGGTPFVSGYIYDVSQSDIRHLAPFAALVILVITFIALRDAIATGLALLGAALAIVMSLGLMGALGVHANVMIGSLPVVVFALGSASILPIVKRYQELAISLDGQDALAQTLAGLSKTVIASGLAAVLSLLSLVFMDIAPMRAFGLFTAVGLAISLILALTFVPAVLRIANVKGRASGEGALRRSVMRLCRAVAVHRGKVTVGLAVVALAGAALATRLESRMDNAAFFSKGSPPALADAFMRDHFGGSQFFQIEVEGDMNDPAVLREVRALADEISLMSHVTSVKHVADVVAKINEAMEGDERIPDTEAKVKLLYGFLAGNRAVTQLSTEDRRFALLQITVDVEGKDELEALLKQVEELVRGKVLERPSAEAGTSAAPELAAARARREALVRLRIQALARRASVPLDPVRLSFEGSQGRGPADAKPAASAILAFLRSEEFIGELPASPTDAAERVSAELGALSRSADKDAFAEALGKALERPKDDRSILDLAASIDKPVREIQKRQQALAQASALIRSLGLAVPGGAQGSRFSTALANALMDLDVPTVLLPAKAGASPASAMKLRVTGLPVMNRGLARSVADNQKRSIVITLGLLFVVMSALYRSIPSGLVAMSPVLLTMLVIYGLMAALGLSLDIGTSMLASLITGAGVTYAVHLLADFRAREGESLGDAAARAAGQAGPAIMTNATMVAAGFLVLTQGEARPLKSVGGLTAAAMIAAAIATFVAIPALARRRRSSAPPRPTGVAPASSKPGTMLDTHTP